MPGRKPRRGEHPHRESHGANREEQALRKRIERLGTEGVQQTIKFWQTAPSKTAPRGNRPGPPRTLPHNHKPAGFPRLTAFKPTKTPNRVSPPEWLASGCRHRRILRKAPPLRPQVPPHWFPPHAFRRRERRRPANATSAGASGDVPAAATSPPVTSSGKTRRTPARPEPITHPGNTTPHSNKS